MAKDLTLGLKIAITVNGKSYNSVSGVCRVIAYTILTRVRQRHIARNGHNWPYARTKAFQDRLIRRIKPRVKWVMSRYT